MGLVHLIDNKSETGKQYLRRSLEINPNGAAHQSRLNQFAYQLAGLDKIAAGLHVLTAAIELNPQVANLYDSKGELFLMKGDTTQSIEFYEKALKIDPEFENAQKRWNKSRQNLRIQYQSSVLKNFLPLYDSFKKAMEAANETEKGILNGFYTQFMGVFKSYGAELIEVKLNDLFDYSLHEALTSIEKEDLPENSIIEIVQDGFKYEKEVIRYAKVIISKKPKPPEPEPKEEAVEEDGISAREEAFLEGQDKDTQEGVCEECGKVLSDEPEEVIEEKKDEQIHFFCSDSCAEKFRKKHKEE